MHGTRPATGPAKALRRARMGICAKKKPIGRAPIPAPVRSGDRGGFSFDGHRLPSLDRAAATDARRCTIRVSSLPKYPAGGAGGAKPLASTRVTGDQ